MRSLYLSIAAGLALTAAAFAGWKYRNEIKQVFTTGVPKVQGMAAHAWGKASQTVTDLLHTEREPQPNGIGFKS